MFDSVELYRWSLGALESLSVVVVHKEGSNNISMAFGQIQPTVALLFRSLSSPSPAAAWRPTPPMVLAARMEEGSRQ